MKKRELEYGKPSAFEYESTDTYAEYPDYDDDMPTKESNTGKFARNVVESMRKDFDREEQNEILRNIVLWLRETRMIELKHTEELAQHIRKSLSQIESI